MTSPDEIYKAILLSMKLVYERRSGGGTYQPIPGGIIDEMARNASQAVVSLLEGSEGERSHG